MRSTVKHIDNLAVQKLKQGDIKAFDELFYKYSQRLYNFSLKYLKEDEAAEDVVQEVFLYIWEKRAGLKPDESFNGYLFTIAHNIIKKHFNKKLRDNAFKNSLIYELQKQDNNLDRVIDYKFLLEKVESIIESLPNRRKEIFIKRKYYSLSLKEIAKELSISPETVEKQLSIAQKQIVAELRKEKLTGLFCFMLFINL
ncbi:MAG: RNA polymerase sigma factor [Mangrovibacterium sp.]